MLPSPTNMVTNTVPPISLWQIIVETSPSGRTKYYIASPSARHRQYFYKDHFGDAFEGLGQPFTEFYFVQEVYYGDDETDGEPSVESVSRIVKDYDYIVYNCGWWNLKDNEDFYCGANWDSGCQDRYDALWAKLTATLFSGSATAVYRGSTCCGDGDADEWVPAILAQNEAAKVNIEAAGGSYVEVFDLFDYQDTVDRTATFDETHPSKEVCLTINLMVLEALDRANGSPCTGGAEETYSPSTTPVSAPTFKPTLEPTSPDTYSPTDPMEVPRTPEPMPAPTLPPAAENTSLPTIPPVAKPTPVPTLPLAVETTPVRLLPESKSYAPAPTQSIQMQPRPTMATSSRTVPTTKMSTRVAKRAACKRMMRRQLLQRQELVQDRRAV